MKKLFIVSLISTMSTLVYADAIGGFTQEQIEVFKASSDYDGSELQEKEYQEAMQRYYQDLYNYQMSNGIYGVSNFGYRPLNNGAYGGFGFNFQSENEVENREFNLGWTYSTDKFKGDGVKKRQDLFDRYEKDKEALGENPSDEKINLLLDTLEQKISEVYEEYGKTYADLLAEQQQRYYRAAQSGQMGGYADNNGYNMYPGMNQWGWGYNPYANGTSEAVFICNADRSVCRNASTNEVYDRRNSAELGERGSGKVDEGPTPASEPVEEQGASAVSEGGN